MRHLFAGTPLHEVHVPFLPGGGILPVMGVRLVGLRIRLPVETRDPRAGDFAEALPCQVVVLYGIVHCKGIHVLFTFGGTDLFEVFDPSGIRRAQVCRFFKPVQLPVIRGHAVIDEA